MKANSETVNCSIPISYLPYYNGDVSLLPNKIYTLTIDYPLNTPLKVLIASGKQGMGLAPLLVQIGKAYHKAYSNDNKYGIWGHDMGDLTLESIKVNHLTKSITLSVGS
jgi:hypothetical protein